MTETADNTAYSPRAFFVLLNIIFLVTTLHILETLSKIMEEQREERLKELDGKVNIKALEKIKFEFGSHKAGLVLFIKSTESL